MDTTPAPEGGAAPATSTSPETPTSIIAPPDGGSPPPPPDAPKGFTAEDGSFSDGWIDRLPEDLHGYRDTFSKYKSVPDLAKALANANHLIGKKLGVPTDKSSPEEVAAFRKAMGIPEKVEEYQIKPEALPEGLDWNDDIAKGFAEVAHKHGIPPKAMQDIVAKYAELELGKSEIAADMIGKQREEAVAALKTEWGGEFDKHIATAQRAVQSVGIDPKANGFGDPEVVKAVVRLASQLSEDKLKVGGDGQQFLSPKARAKDIMTNPQNPFYKRYQEGDREVAEMVSGLLRQG